MKTSASRLKLRRSCQGRGSDRGKLLVIADEELRMFVQHAVREQVAQSRLRPAVDDASCNEVEGRRAGSRRARSRSR
jgi:hypothetical protein